MKTIASVVENYIKTKPFLSTALSQGIINLTSLSRQIQPEIELALQKEARSGAIVMALKRISDNMEFLSTHKIVKVLKGIGDITVRSSLVDYSFKISETLLSAQASFLAQVNDNKEAFYTSSRGVSESNIVISSTMKHLVAIYFENEVLLEKSENLSSVTIKLQQRMSTFLEFIILFFNDFLGKESTSVKQSAYCVVQVCDKTACFVLRIIVGSSIDLGTW